MYIVKYGERYVSGVDFAHDNRVVCSLFRNPAIKFRTFCSAYKFVDFINSYKRDFISHCIIEKFE